MNWFINQYRGQTFVCCQYKLICLRHKIDISTECFKKKSLLGNLNFFGSQEFVIIIYSIINRNRFIEECIGWTGLQTFIKSKLPPITIIVCLLSIKAYYFTTYYCHIIKYHIVCLQSNVHRAIDNYRSKNKKQNHK